MSTQENIAQTAESPCIGICSTVYGDNICRGCKRDYREVIDWNRYAPAKKQEINQRLQQDIQMITARFISVENVEQLKSHIQRIAIRPLLYNSPLCWAYELLRLKAQQINALSDYGLRAKTPYENLGVNALFTRLDDALYLFSQQENLEQKFFQSS